MTQNRLSLNVSKTKLMLLGSRQKLRNVGNLNLILNGQATDSVDEFKYLGIIVDKHLLFHQHVDHIVDKTTNKLGLIYKTRWLFDESTALVLFKSLIVPHFDYGSVIYEVALEYQLRRLQINQNAASRLVLLAEPDCPIYRLHERLHLDTLATRRSKAMVKITYACIHDQQPIYMN